MPFGREKGSCGVQLSLRDLAEEVEWKQKESDDGRADRRDVNVKEGQGESEVEVYVFSINLRVLDSGNLCPLTPINSKD